MRRHLLDRGKIQRQAATARILSNEWPTLLECTGRILYICNSAGVSTLEMARVCSLPVRFSAQYMESISSFPGDLKLVTTLNWIIDPYRKIMACSWCQVIRQMSSEQPSQRKTKFRNVDLFYTYSGEFRATRFELLIDISTSLCQA